MLSNAAGQVYDSLSFGQQTVDTSMGRCYKIGWKWAQLPFPTAGKENQCWPLSVATILPEYATIFPNPTSDILYIHTYSNLTQNIQVRDVTGRLVFSEKGRGQLSIYTFDWAIGIYFLQVGNSYHKFAVVH